MKHLLLALLVISGSALANDPFKGTTKITLSPFQLTAETLAFTSGGALLSTLASAYEGRGVAGREQLRDDLVAYDRDVRRGKVKDVSEIRQQGLKEIVLETLSNKEAMNEISAIVPQGTPADKVVAVLAMSLF